MPSRALPPSAVTIHRLRTPGMTWYKMPVFLWSLYATSVILVLATPLLAMTLVLLAFEPAGRSARRSRRLTLWDMWWQRWSPYLSPVSPPSPPA
jgi:hypothetical protein